MSDDLDKEITKLLGKPISYWIELDRRVHLLADGGRIMSELLAAEAKVSYYERHIAEMDSFRKYAESMKRSATRASHDYYCGP